ARFGVRGAYLKKLVFVPVQEIPSRRKVFAEAVGLILGEDIDEAKAGIEAVGQGEIHDAEPPAEGNGGLGLPVRQVHETVAAPARKDDGQCLAGRVGMVV